MTAAKGWLRADWYWEHRLTPIDTLTAITGRTADSLRNSFRRNGISHPAHRVQVELPDILYPRRRQATARRRLWTLFIPGRVRCQLWPAALRGLAVRARA